MLRFLKGTVVLVCMFWDECVQLFVPQAVSESMPCMVTKGVCRYDMRTIITFSYLLKVILAAYLVVFKTWVLHKPQRDSKIETILI